MMLHRWLLHRLLTPLAVITLLATGLLGPGLVESASAQPASTPILPPGSGFSPDGNPLLLVHGFNDTCDFAFNQTDEYPNTGANALTTVQYLTQHGWSSSPSALDEIGYYNPTLIFSDLRLNGDTVSAIDGTANESTGTAQGRCTHNLQEAVPFSSTAGQDCATFANGVDFSNASNPPLEDPLEHLGCLLAWYIYNTYTQKGIAVDILAHSMGGLLVRDAIGESGGSPQFPPLLNVHKVVTVGSPHGGVWGEYFALALQLFNGAAPRELLDMYPTSDFMGMLNNMDTRNNVRQPPQGLHGTYWALIASSVHCNASPFHNNLFGTGYVSCQADELDNLASGYNTPYPEGDGVVQAESALDMPANLKILYGRGVQCSGPCPGGTGTPYNSGGPQYSHEANSCGNITILNNTNPFCLDQPFYLNDGSPGTTLAYVCDSSCTHGTPGVPGPLGGPAGGGMIDMPLFDSNMNALQGQPVLYSLAEIVSIFSAPAPQGWVGATNSGLLQPFTAIAEGQIWFRRQHCAIEDCWGSWSALGGPSYMTGDPAVARSLDGRQEIFARDDYGTGTLWTAWQNCPDASCGWTNWVPMVDQVAGDPAVAVSATGQMEVFVVRSDGALWSAWQVCAGCSWSGWVSFGGNQTGNPILGTPTVVLSADGRFQAFVRLRDGTMETSWQACLGCGWTGWTTYATHIQGDPTLTLNRDGRMEVFAEGQDGTLWHRQQACVGCGWSVWSSLNSPNNPLMAGKPAVVQSPDGRLEVFVWGIHQELWTAWQTSPGSSTWSTWYQIATNVYGSPGANLTGDGRMQVFYMYTDPVSGVSQLWYVSQPCVSCAWSSPVNLGNPLF